MPLLSSSLTAWSVPPAESGMVMTWNACKSWEMTCSKWFNISNGSATPKDYLSFDTPMATGAVRLGVFRLTDAESDRLASAVHEATQHIVQLLPEGHLQCCALNRPGGGERKIHFEHWSSDWMNQGPCDGHSTLK